MRSVQFPLSLAAATFFAVRREDLLCPVKEKASISYALEGSGFAAVLRHSTALSLSLLHELELAAPPPPLRPAPSLSFLHSAQLSPSTPIPSQSLQRPRSLDEDQTRERTHSRATSSQSQNLLLLNLASFAFLGRSLVRVCCAANRQNPRERIYRERVRERER